MATSFDLKEFRKKIFEGNSDLGAIIITTRMCMSEDIACLLVGAGQDLATKDTRFAKVVSSINNLIDEGILPDTVEELKKDLAYGVYFKKALAEGFKFRYKYAVNLLDFQPTKERICDLVGAEIYVHQYDAIVDGLRIAIFRNTTEYM